MVSRRRAAAARVAAAGRALLAAGAGRSRGELERAAGEQLHEVLRELREGVVVLGRDGAVEEVNPSAAVLLARAGVDASWLREAASAAGEGVVERARRTGEGADDVTTELAAPDGGRRLLSLSVRPLDARAPHRVVVSFVDVTERTAAAESARTMAARVSATLEGLTEGVVYYDEELVRQGVNAAGQAMLGIGADGWVDRSVGSSQLEVLGEDGRPLPPEAWPAVAVHRSGRALTGFVMGFRRAGQPLRWVSVNTSPLGAAERPEGPWPVVSSFTDITERLHRERALAEAEQRVRSTFDAAPVGMRVAALDGTCLEANKAFADLLGAAAEDLVGRRAEELTHPDDRDAEREGRRRLLAGEVATSRLEQRFLHAAGHAVWAQVDVTVLRDADGRPTATIGHVQDISERRHHDEQLRHLADHDGLTGLLNRRSFQAELERHVVQAERYGTTGALMVLDLDHFKYVNDTLGHKAGDELIVAVADLLRTRLRKTDVIARLGGDEFAVLLPRGTREQANAAAEAVLSALRERQGDLPTLGRFKLTASVGVATLEDPTLTADELMVNADLAMYDAKEEGRDQVADYATGRYQEPRARSRSTWMERIHAALEGDRFLLFAQPIHDIAAGEVAMHELLLRMRGEDGDVIPPGTFLFIAERFDLIQEIDRWVVDRACGLLAGNPDGSALTINASGKSINDPDRLLAHIAAALDRTGVDPSRLVVEVTETAAVSQINHARVFARDLRRMGCRLAIDDFGAGFGSFYYLKHLPFDFLKIDGEFVTHARTSRADALIVAALRDMAHGLGRQVIGEYCADQETLDYLRAERIDLAQGFHLGRPAPAEHVLALAP